MVEYLEVAGAGTVECNGVYQKLHGQRAQVDIWVMQTAAGKKYYIRRSTDRNQPRWRLATLLGGGLWFYVNESSAPIPPTEGWEIYADNIWGEGGKLPAPTVTASSSTCRKRCLESGGEVLAKVWKQRKFTDAEVVCNGTRIPIHRSTLGASSPVFEAAFSSTMKEGESAVYQIEDSTPEAVEAMLCFMYTGELPPVELFPEVFELAMRYELDKFAKLTAMRMAEEVCVNNVKAFLNVLKLHSARSEHAQNGFQAILRKIKEAPSYELLTAAV